MLQGDGVHPTVEGDQVIASKVAPLIINAVKLVLSRRSV
jgi:lysophospholipase L1-like esterase